MAFSEGALAQIRWFAEVGHSLDRSQTRRLCSLVEACKHFLKIRFIQLLAEHPGSPLLLQYSGDCTPSHVRQYGVASQSFKQRRLSGSKAVEFFVQQTFITIGAPDDSRVHSVLLADPLVLEFGKTMPALLAAALGCPGLRLPDCGRRIIILHQVQDRAMTSSFRHALSGAWVSSLSSPMSGQAQGSQVDPQDATQGSSSLLHWHCSLGCSCHDGHNTLRWAAQMADDSSDMVKNVFVALHLPATAKASWLPQPPLDSGSVRWLMPSPAMSSPPWMA